MPPRSPVRAASGSTGTFGWIFRTRRCLPRRSTCPGSGSVRAGTWAARIVPRANYRTVTWCASLPAREEPVVRVNREPPPVRPHRDQPVHIGPQHDRAMTLQPLENLRVWMTVPVIDTRRDDGERGRHCVQELLRTGRFAPVVGHLQHVYPP